MSKESQLIKKYDDVIKEVKDYEGKSAGLKRRQAEINIMQIIEAEFQTFKDLYEAFK